MLTSLMDRMPRSPAFLPPVVVSGALLVTWAWLAGATAGLLPALILTPLLGWMLFGAWLRFVRSTRETNARASGGLLTQLTPENRTNRRLALYDTASGLYNRWYLELRLQEEYLRCARYGLSMAVVCMKLGNFGLAAMSNDSWGGIAAEIGRIMARSLRAVDITAALGPLEFAVCLVHCDRAGAESAISRVLDQLGGQPAQIGLAVYPDDDCDGKALVELARRRAVGVEMLEKGA